MDKNIFISVIIPVYNVEKYLRKSINSILEQSYKNYEIILIDDGSTDSSGLICDEYSKKHCFIKTFHKKNGGLSSARNYGIDKSSGNYICFLDSDDWYSDNAFEEFEEGAIIIPFPLATVVPIVNTAEILNVHPCRNFT